MLYAHPEGLDPVVDTPFLCKHCKDCHDFTAVEAKAGDAFILHGFLPHTNSYNYKHYARVITNPHVTLKEPYNLNRGPGDGDYVSLNHSVVTPNTSADPGLPVAARTSPPPCARPFLDPRIPPDAPQDVLVPTLFGL